MISGGSNTNSNASAGSLSGKLVVKIDSGGSPTTSSRPTPQNASKKKLDETTTPKSSKAKAKLLTVASRDENDSGSDQETKPVIPKILVKSGFKKKIVGDIFGSATTEQSLEGLMYRSRIVERNPRTVNEDTSQEDLLFNDTNFSSKTVEDSDSASDNESSLLKTMGPKQQLAVTIKNWSIFPENDEHIIKEGAVYALIALSHLDDSVVKRCCASAFFQLSSREKNRSELLNMGSTGGVITLAMQARSWKVAKLSALTLCNFSMEKGGEAVMSKEGAILALVVLLGIKGQSLLPVCVQALYNLTSSQEHFKGTERIIKALLNMASMGYDHWEFLVKGLVNCSRFSWLRLRIIEDGAINSLNTLVPSLNGRENRQEFVFHILTALRSLSDSSGCRADMLQKGSIELMNSIIMYCGDKERLLVVKILHNFLQTPSQMSIPSFTLAVEMIYDIAFKTNLIVILQYCAACFQIATKEKLKGVKSLSINIIECLALLMRMQDHLIHYFAISTAGNIFFNSLCEDMGKVELLVKYFVIQGSEIVDSSAKQALALALAKLTQESTYLALIEKLGLLDKVLSLLMQLRKENPDSMLLQESCCVSMARIALRLQELLSQPEKEQIASVLLSLLNSNDENVLTSVISSIRALGDSGLCPKEFLSNKTFLSQIATIVAKYSYNIDLSRLGCAVLAVFSYDVEAHECLADKHILSVLFANINSDDDRTRECVANALCNLSLHAKACETMISMNVVEVMGQLSSSTSETILDLCSKSLCNLTCNQELHQSMISNQVLEILLMIALVRTVSSSTKCTCAKALLNLLTDENLTSMTKSGAIRVFGSLAMIPYPPLQKVCSKGFHLMTVNVTRRRELVKNRSVLQAFLSMIKSSNANSPKVNLRLGISLINILSCEETNIDAMNAGALSCLKIVATMELEKLRDAAARIVINLSANTKLHTMLLREPIVAMLVYILQKHEVQETFEKAIYALSSLSQIGGFKGILIRDKAMDALFGAVFMGRVQDQRIAQEICRIWCHLSYAKEQSEYIIQSNAFAIAVQLLAASNLAANSNTKTLILIAIRNLSETAVTRSYIVEQGIFSLLLEAMMQDSKEVFARQKANSYEELGIPPIGYAATIRIVYNLCLSPELHESILSQGLMDLIKVIAMPLFKSFETPTDATESPKYHQRLHLTVGDIDLLTTSLQLLSQTQRCHETMVNGGLMRIYKALIYAELSNDSKCEISACLAQVSQSKGCRETLVKQSAVELLIALAIDSDVNFKNTQAQCATALAYLSEITVVRSGIVAALQLLGLRLEGGDIVKTRNVSKASLSALQSAAAATVAANASSAPSANKPATPLTAVAAAAVTAAAAESAAAAAAAAATAKANGQNPSQQTLQTLMREFVSDKKRFEAYRDALAVSTIENLRTNEFCPSLDSGSGTGSAGGTGGTGGTGGGARQSFIRAGTTVASLSFDEGNNANSSNNNFRRARSSLSPNAAEAQRLQSDLTKSAPHTRIAVKDGNKEILAMEEKRAQGFDFIPYAYPTALVNVLYRFEFGGLSRQLDVELPLPCIAPDRDMDQHGNRSDELLKIPVNQEPLPKDLRIPQILDHTKTLSSEMKEDSFDNRDSPGSFDLGSSSRDRDRERDRESGGISRVSSRDSSAPGGVALAVGGAGGGGAAAGLSRGSGAQRKVVLNKISSNKSSSAAELGKDNPLDSRSPLLSSTQIFASASNMSLNSSAKPSTAPGLRK